MKAQSTRGVFLPDPYHYGYEVVFGLGENHLGVLVNLDNQIAIWQWVQENDASIIAVEGWRVLFWEEKDANALYGEFP